MMVQMNLKGSMIETHTEALTLDLAPEDLVYSPPEGAKKKESLGQMISLGMAAAGSKCPLSKTASAVPTVSGAGTAQDSTPLPPDLERARAKARVASCANNLKQCGLIIKMFANEAPNQWLPPLAPKSGSPMWLKEAIYPEYLTDPVILLCPAEEEKSRAISELKDFDPRRSLPSTIRVTGTWAMRFPMRRPAWPSWRRTGSRWKPVEISRPIYKMRTVIRSGGCGRCRAFLHSGYQRSRSLVQSTGPSSCDPGTPGPA